MGLPNKSINNKIKNYKMYENLQTLKLVFYLGKITLCFVIIGLCGFLCPSIKEVLNSPISFYYKYKQILIILNFGSLDLMPPEHIIKALIKAATIACCIASIYFLFKGYYDTYISKKILRLYGKADGEYIIISDSKLLFWLPLFWTNAVYIVGIGIKAKKNGDYLELSGIRGELPRYDCFCFKFEEVGYVEDTLNYKGTYFYGFGDIGFHGNHIIFAYNQHRWLFVRLGSNEEWLFLQLGSNEYGRRNYGYDYVSLSYHHLMGIYFGGKGLYFEDNFEDNKIEEIIYNIITQTGENKVIRKSIGGIDGDFITEYYYEMENDIYQLRKSISKRTRAKEGRYHYYINNLHFDIKEFMQIKNIQPKGLFEYKINSYYSVYYDIVYCLNGNYFKYIRVDLHECHLEQITLEEYLEILEADCKYQRDEEKRRKIIYNIITQTGENEVIFAVKLVKTGENKITRTVTVNVEDESREYYYEDENRTYRGEDTSIEYYYKEKHPIYNNHFYHNKYRSISKEITSGQERFKIEWCDFWIKDFMQLNDIHPEDLFIIEGDNKYIYYCLNGNYFYCDYGSGYEHEPIYIYSITKEEFEQEKGHI